MLRPVTGSKRIRQHAGRRRLQISVLTVIALGCLVGLLLADFCHDHNAPNGYAVCHMTAVVVVGAKPRPVQLSPVRHVATVVVAGDERAPRATSVRLTSLRGPPA